jgi:hypothetical protein
MCQPWPASRLRQFWRGLRAQVHPAEYEMVAAILPAAGVALFRQMPLDAQRHSLDVLATLRAGGFEENDLAAAALLHDVGKVAAGRSGHRLGLWWRGPLVLLEALMPSLLGRLASTAPEAGWRYLLFVQREHAAISAAWAERAGCTPETCWLIARHQDQTPPIADEERLTLLRALQWADNAN